MKQLSTPRWSIVVLDNAKQVTHQSEHCTLIDAIQQQSVYVLHGAFRVTIYDTTTLKPLIVLHSSPR